MLQLKVKAVDMASRERESENVNVTVSVGRNKHAPVFTEDSYSTSIPEDTKVGQGVITIRADDNDQGVSHVYM